MQQSSPGWTDKLLEQVQPEFSDDSFWISAESIDQIFSHLYVTHIKEWEELRIKGDFTKLESDYLQIQNDEVISKYVYQITVKQKQLFFIGIH